MVFNVDEVREFCQDCGIAQLYTSTFCHRCGAAHNVDGDHAGIPPDNVLTKGPIPHVPANGIAQQIARAIGGTQRSRGVAFNLGAMVANRVNAIAHNQNHQVAGVVRTTDRSRRRRTAAPARGPGRPASDIFRVNLYALPSVNGSRYFNRNDERFLFPFTSKCRFSALMNAGLIMSCTFPRNASADVLLGHLRALVPLFADKTFVVLKPVGGSQNLQVENPPAGGWSGENIQNSYTL